MRSYTIALEGSTYAGSVAILRDSEVIAERTLGGDGAAPRSGRGDQLMPALAECVRETGVKEEDVSRIVCGAGPGSFTSLRVAGSVAKGLAVGYGVELYAVSSLLLTIAGARPELPEGEYLSVLDAMRGEFFALRVTVMPGDLVVQSGATTLTTGGRISELASQVAPSLKVVGPGQQLNYAPHARGVAPLLPSILEGGPVDLASWEPDYGRLAEAQVRWEAEHGRPLPT
jgi:tRNA threonylcarbamoyladenosine biosynthesis protein TsaB